MAEFAGNDYDLETTGISQLLANYEDNSRFQANIGPIQDLSDAPVNMNALTIRVFFFCFSY